MLTNVGPSLATADVTQDGCAHGVGVGIPLMSHGGQGIAVALSGALDDFMPVR
jgi:hypothetical protein